jgi:hypothetical protein
MATKRYGKIVETLRKFYLTKTNNNSSIMYLVASSFSAGLPASKKGSQKGFAKRVRKIAHPILFESWRWFLHYYT